MATIPNEIALGKDCTITFDEAEVSGIVDVSINCSADSIDTSTRDDGGFSADLPGKKSVSISINMRSYKTGAKAESQKPVYDAWLSQTPTGVEVTVGGGFMTFSGLFVVESLDETQNLDGSVDIAVSLKNYGALTPTGGGTGGGTGGT